LFTGLKTEGDFDFSKLRIGVIYEGKLEEPRGTPLRMLKWVVLSAQSGAQVNLLASSISAHVANKLGVTVFESVKSVIGNSDVVFVLNYNGLFRVRKLIRKNNCQFIVDLHSLRSRELRSFQLLEFIRQSFIEFASSFISRRNRALLVTVNLKMTRKYFANIGNRVLEVQGGTTSSNIRHAEFKFDFGYAGNTRHYQGLEFLFEAFDRLWRNGVNFTALIISSDDSPNFEERPYLTVISRLNSQDALRRISECRVLVVPRTKARENRYSFPSKIYDYLSTDSAIVLTTEVPLLPSQLEATVLRFDVKDSSDFANSLLESLSTLRHQGKFERDFDNQYSWDTQFAKVIEKVVYDL
jgi:hypothetical protein